MAKKEIAWCIPQSIFKISSYHDTICIQEKNMALNNEPPIFVAKNTILLLNESWRTISSIACSMYELVPTIYVIVAHVKTIVESTMI